MKTYTKTQEERSKEQKAYWEDINNEALKVLIRWKVAAGEIKLGV